MHYPSRPTVFHCASLKSSATNNFSRRKKGVIDLWYFQSSLYLSIETKLMSPGFSCGWFCQKTGELRFYFSWKLSIHISYLTIITGSEINIAPFFTEISIKNNCFSIYTRSDRDVNKTRTKLFKVHFAWRVWASHFVSFGSHALFTP